MIDSVIYFRAHHFLCAFCFVGFGYNDSFTKNFTRVVRRLNASPSQTIQVIAQSDVLCAPCQHRSGNQCHTEDKIRHLDQQHAMALGLIHGEHLSWQEAKIKIRERITLEVFANICQTCEWQKLGICEKVIRTEITNAAIID